MIAALFVNRPVGGCVESVLTCETHRFCRVRGIEPSSAGLRADCGGNGGPSRIRRAGWPYIGNNTKLRFAETVQYWLYPTLYADAGSLR